MKKLGFGCMRLPVLGESKDFMSAEDIDLTQFCQMVDRFMERGFTYFDTSYVYHNGKSEVFLKEALVKRYPRESFLLADKLPTFSITRPEQVPVIFEEQLERCGVSYFDYYLLHNIWETNYDTNRDGWEMWRRCAALVMFSSLAISKKYRRTLISI